MVLDMTHSDPAEAPAHTPDPVVEAIDRQLAEQRRTAGELQLIQRAEDRRIAGLLQLCRWVAQDDDPLQDDLDTEGDDTGGDGTHAVTIICAIQRDLVETVSRRHWLMRNALGILARRWADLPVDGRTVVLAALLPDRIGGAPFSFTDWAKIRNRLSTADADRLTASLARKVLGL